MSSASARNTSNVAPPDKEPPFLRRPQAVPRKRRPGLVRFALAGALALLAAAGLVRFASSSRFALRRYDVSGTSRARTEEILQSLAPWNGRNVVTLDLAPLAVRLGAHPWIERVTIAKRFPDGLAVRITERRAVALFREGENFSWVTSDGRLIAGYDPRRDRTAYSWAAQPQPRSPRGR